MGLFSKIKEMFKGTSNNKEEVTIENEFEDDEEFEEIEEDSEEFDEEYSKQLDEEVDVQDFDEESDTVSDDEVVSKTESKVKEKDAWKKKDKYNKNNKNINPKQEIKKEAEYTNDEKAKINKEVKIYEKGLTRTRKTFVSNLIGLTNRYQKITEEYFEELEEILIMADIGVNTVMNFMERLRDRVRKEKIEKTEDLKEIIVDELFIIYVDDNILTNKIRYAEEGPTVLLFVGVNGVGKTTTIGKLAWKLKSEGKKVLLVAGDTFRAGATRQLEEWSKKVEVGFVGKDEGADPAAVVFDGLKKAKDENYDVVLIDTAGRLQNRVNLMSELEKINRIIGREIPDAPHETLLIIDATTGQNGISQAKKFKEITNITGITLTKLDGTAKGGIVLAIKEEVNLPVKYIGLGEGKEDLQSFDIEKYIYGLFKDMM